MPGSKRHVRNSAGEPISDLWELRVAAPPGPTGKRRQVSRRFKGSERGANRALAELWRAVEAEAVAPPGKTTLGELLDRYLTHLEVLGRSPRTTEGYRGWRRRELGSLEGVRLDKLTTAQLDAIYARMLRQGKDARSVHAVQALLHGALKQAKRWGLVASNVADDTSKPPVSKTRPKAPTPEQVRRILAAVVESDPDYAVYLRVAAATGCRRGEVVGFQWRDVDWSAGTIAVVRSVISTTRTGVQVKDTKTHQQDSLPLDGGTLAVLEAHRGRCEERARLGELELRPESFLFSEDLDGTRSWHPDTPSGRFRRVRVLADVPDVQLRQLRHYVGTQVLAKTGDLKAAQSMLRHAHGSTTLGFYAASIPANTRSASDLIGAQLDG